MVCHDLANVFTDERAGGDGCLAAHAPAPFPAGEEDLQW